MSYRAAIYARISTDDKKVPKVENQIAACRALAQAEGYEVAAVFADDGIPASGKSIKDSTRDKRPDFDKLLKRAVAGEFDVLIAVEGERLARTYPDGIDVIDACVRGGASLLFDTDGAIDPRTPQGEVSAMNIFVVGRKEGRVKSARQGRRYSAERKLGMPLWGQRTFGFAALDEVNQSGRVTKRWVLHNEKEAEALRLVANVFLQPAGKTKYAGTLYGAARYLNDYGFKTTRAGQERKKPNSDTKYVVDGTWTVSSVRELLRNPKIAGYLTEDGKIVEGVKAAWKPIVEPEVWHLVQEKLNVEERRTSPGRKPKSLCGGLVFCACGSAMRSTTVNQEPGLRCGAKRDGRTTTKGHASISSRVLDPLVIDAVASAFTLGPQALVHDADSDTSAIDARLLEIRESRSAFADLIESGGFDKADVSTRLAKLKEEEADLEEQRQKVIAGSARAAMFASLSGQMFKDGRADLDVAAATHERYRRRFEGLPVVQRRQLVQAFLRVTVGPGRGAERVSIEHLIAVSLNDDVSDITATSVDTLPR